MIRVSGVKFKTIEQALEYFEPSISRITNKYLGHSPEKDDCRQELRLSVCKLYSNEEKEFNSLYVVTRLKWNTINFINRDAGYNWPRKFIGVDDYKDVMNSTMLDEMCSIANKEDIRHMLTDLLDKSSGLLSFRQKEALVIFLSGAPAPIIRKFFGIKGVHLTKYYLLLSEAIGILKEVADDDIY